MYCSQCGSEITDNTKFCSKCGIKVSIEEIATTTNSPEVFNIPGAAYEVGSSVAVSQVRPWVRYFARTLDIFLLHSIFAIVCLVIGIRIQLYTSLLVGMILPVAWLFVEPVFLSQWGATPGKLLLRIRITHQNGEFLSYDEAFSRSVNVWLRGEALYIPVVLLVANIIAYNRLTKFSITTWDKTGSFLVQHSRIGTSRIIVLVVLFVATYYISGAIVSFK